MEARKKPKHRAGIEKVRSSGMKACLALALGGLGLHTYNSFLDWAFSHVDLAAIAIVLWDQFLSFLA